MRRALRQIFNVCVAATPPWMLRGFFKVFVARPEVAERAGFQVYPKVYYSPFPDPDEVDVSRLSRRRELPGVAIDMDAALGLLRQLSAFTAELEQFPRDPATGSIEWSHTYPSFDTAALYAMLRHLKPRRYIEIGCGYSTRVSSAALRRNLEEGINCNATFIEPFPPPHFLRDSLPGDFIQSKVEDVPLSLFQSLKQGDVLFIDSTHVIKVQNDVEHELLRVLPSLAAGVHVHIHDIMTPYDYPAEWLVGSGPNRGGCNEQYALECLMSGGGEWSITLPLHCIWRELPAELQSLVPRATDYPVAIWIRKER